VKSTAVAQVRVQYRSLILMELDHPIALSESYLIDGGKSAQRSWVSGNEKSTCLYLSVVALFTECLCVSADP
jgi:hypothetical protein